MALLVVLAAAPGARAEWVWDSELGWIDMSQTSVASDRGLYAHARGLFIRGDYAAALETFEEIEKRFPDSDYIPNVKFGKAKCEAHLGRHRRALDISDQLLQTEPSAVPVETIVAFQVETLKDMMQTGPHAAADLLDAVAERAPTPELKFEALMALGAARFQVADYDEALNGYRAAFDAAPKACQKNDAMFELARCEIVACRELGHDEAHVRRALEGFQKLRGVYTKGERADAVKQYIWITQKVLDSTDPQMRHVYYTATYMPEKRYDEAYSQFKEAARKLPGTPAGEAARFFQAECLYLQGEFWSAFKAYENLIREYPNTSRMRDAVEHEFAAAEKLRGQGAFGKAVMVFEAAARNDPSGPLADDAQMQAGLLHLEADRYEDAKDAFSIITRHYPQSEWSSEAMLRSGEADLKNSMSASNNEEFLVKARRSFELVLQADPKGKVAQRANALLTECDEREAQVKWGVARFYERRNQPRAAAVYYRILIRKHPESSFAAKALAALDRHRSQGVRSP